MNGLTTAATPLHIVEPILNNEAGHCMSLVRALTQAAAEAGCRDVTVWGGREAAQASWQGPARLQPHFIRKWRRLQALALYRRLLRQAGRVLISTAGSADLVSLDLAARTTGLGQIPAGKVSLFVHWLNAKPGKMRLYQRIARRQPHLQILAPTASVAEFFKACGFDAQVVPYPVDMQEVDTSPSSAPHSFRHLLVPGAARMDKGFGHIADLLDEMHCRSLPWPIVVQTSLEHGHEKDESLMTAIHRVQRCPLAGLQRQPEALAREDYMGQFRGAIVIQPYSAQSFRDRVSGVTLDALRAGAPVVVTADTWMARLIGQHRAGVATGDLSPSGLIGAIEAILADHEGYARRASEAAEAIASTHSARGLIDAVLMGAKT